MTSKNAKQLRHTDGWRVVPLILLLIFGSLHVCHASDGFTNEIAEARTLYLDAVESGDKRDLRKAIRQINGLAQRYPDHALVLVYQGCALAERGRDERERPVNRMRDTEEGLQLIDRGLRQLQQGELTRLDAAEARLTAAMLFIHLPDDIFHRFKQGESLVAELLTEPRLDEMPGPLQAGIYLAAAIVADKKRDRVQLRHYLEMTLKAAPKGRNAQKASEMLAALMD